MRWMGLIALGLASPAVAAPTYLECRFPTKPDHPIRLTSDEGTGSVSLFVPSTGHTETFQGTFLPDRVIFKGGMLDYEISRTDLSIKRTIRMINSVDAGTCAVVDAPKRAF